MVQMMDFVQRTRRAPVVTWSCALRSAALSARFVLPEQQLQHPANFDFNYCASAPEPPNSTQTTCSQACFYPAITETHTLSTSSVPDLFARNSAFFPHINNGDINARNLCLPSGASVPCPSSSNSCYKPSAAYIEMEEPILSVEMPATAAASFAALQQLQQQQQHILQNYISAKVHSLAVNHLHYINEVVKTAWLEFNIDSLKYSSKNYWQQLSQLYYAGDNNFSSNNLLQSRSICNFLIQVDLKLYKLLLESIIPVPETDAVYNTLSDQDFSSMHAFFTTALYNAPQAYLPLPMALKAPLACALVAFCRTCLERLELIYGVRSALRLLRSTASESSIGPVINDLKTYYDAVNIANPEDADSKQSNENTIVASSNDDTIVNYYGTSFTMVAEQRPLPPPPPPPQKSHHHRYDDYEELAGPKWFSTDEPFSINSNAPVLPNCPPYIRARARQLVLEQLQILLQLPASRKTVDSVFSAGENIIAGMLAVFQPPPTSSMPEQPPPQQQHRPRAQDKLFAYLGRMPSIMQNVTNGLTNIVYKDLIVAANNNKDDETNGASANTVRQLRVCLDMLSMAVKFMADCTHDQMQQIDNPMLCGFIGNLLNQTHVLQQAGLLECDDNFEMCEDNLSPTFCVLSPRVMSPCPCNDAGHNNNMMLDDVAVYSNNINNNNNTVIFAPDAAARNRNAVVSPLSAEAFAARVARASTPNAAAAAATTEYDRNIFSFSAQDILMASGGTSAATSAANGHNNLYLYNAAPPAAAAATYFDAADINLQYVESSEVLPPEYASLSSQPTQILMVTGDNLDGLVCMEQLTGRNTGANSNANDLRTYAAAHCNLQQQLQHFQQHQQQQQQHLQQLYNFVPPTPYNINGDGFAPTSVMMTASMPMSGTTMTDNGATVAELDDTARPAMLSYISPPMTANRVKNNNVSMQSSKQQHQPAACRAKPHHPTPVALAPAAFTTRIEDITCAEEAVDDSGPLVVHHHHRPRHRQVPPPPPPLPLVQKHPQLKFQAPSLSRRQQQSRKRALEKGGKIRKTPAGRPFKSNRTLARKRTLFLEKHQQHDAATTTTREPSSCDASNIVRTPDDADREVAEEEEDEEAVNVSLAPLTSSSVAVQT